jgi:sugar O-acyltransferase (sialic acid O-acetyltransferase NeuD family)
MNMRLALIGGGDLAQQLAHYVRTYEKEVEIIGFVDDFAIKGEEKFGIPCIGTVTDVLDLYAYGQFDKVILGIGYKHQDARQKLFEKLHPTVPFYTFIHPTAFIDVTAKVGDGCCVGPHTVLEQRTVIGHNVFLYGGVNVSHDSKIGAHTFVAPSVTIAGFVDVGQRCFLGLHSTIIEHVRIADDVALGAASLVLHDLAEPGVYIGAPTRKKTSYDYF